MLLNQSYTDILNSDMDIIDAMSVIQAAAQLRKPPKEDKKKAFKR